MELSLELGCQRESILGEQKHAKVKNGCINVSKVVDIVFHLCIRIFWIFVIFILHIGTTGIAINGQYSYNISDILLKNYFQRNLLLRTEQILLRYRWYVHFFK